MAKKKAIDLSARHKRMPRKRLKSIRFNDKEIAAIEQYCKKYKIKSQAAFFREVIISTVLQRFDEDYPKLF